MALACAVVPSEWNDCIRSFLPRGTAAQAKACYSAMLLRRVNSAVRFRLKICSLVVAIKTTFPIF